MALNIIIEVSIPEDYPAGIPENRLKKEMEAIVKERLGLRVQDNVLITFRGAQ